MIFLLVMSRTRPLPGVRCDVIRGTEEMSGDEGDTLVSLSCSNLFYEERDLSSSEGVDNAYRDEDSEDGSPDPLGLQPYQYKPVGLSESAVMESSSDEDNNKADWRMGNTSWYALVANRVLIN